MLLTLTVLFASALVALIPFASIQSRLAALLVVFVAAGALHLLARPFVSATLNAFEVSAVVQAFVAWLDLSSCRAVLLPWRASLWP